MQRYLYLPRLSGRNVLEQAIICRSKFTICSALYLFIGMTGLPPGEFSLISPGTKIPGQVRPISI
jgi:hypothetical protein